MNESRRPLPTGSQRDRFIEAARELGCDEGEEGFAEIVRKLASLVQRIHVT